MKTKEVVGELNGAIALSGAAYANVDLTGIESLRLLAVKLLVKLTDPNGAVRSVSVIQSCN
jgi:hypothetical protein